MIQSVIKSVIKDVGRNVINRSSGGGWTPRYYVSNTGNDALDGLSPINAWQTIAKVNNEVIKYNGNYYVYFHSQPGATNGIYRAYSSDLITWTQEGKILNNRDLHGAPYITFGDQCLVQFKGKSYIFWGASDQTTTYHIDCGIDNRPLAEMLALTP